MFVAVKGGGADSGEGMKKKSERPLTLQTRCDWNRLITVDKHGVAHHSSRSLGSSFVVLEGKAVRMRWDDRP